ncbi:type IV secretion system protein VirB10 [Massilia sp. R2A-15]|uniref:type IV secretion system protein VirB10 n=1 Tax=Massilia sp. R2A-15 TaxID=3064278 RepID=UPI002734DADD|nr:type IV secretion system protein VirB10 [Massilia sp. R2A-15]WLI91077.1 type IV secretion system protein VirB10 [Massilia sp. R2A-15]
MSQLREDQPAQTIPEPTGIVSVNSRGGPSPRRGGKIVAIVIAAALLVTATAMSLAKYRDAGKAQDAARRLASADQNKPGDSGKRRIFNTDPPPLPGAAAPNRSVGAGDASIACPAGATSRPLLGPDGMPMTGPGGQPIRVCGNGQVIVPAIAPMPADSVAPIPLIANGTKDARGAHLPPPASRYGGDVVLPPPASGATQAFDPNNPYIQALLRSSAGTGHHEDPAQATAAQPLPAPHTIASPQGALATMPTGGAAKAVSATMIGNRDMILPEGRSIDCNLSVRIVSEVSGKATCVLSSNVYSDNGKVVLAERGSTAVGEYVATMAQGQRRLFILWTRLQTPNGVVVNVNSPAADALGTSGSPGHVDNRWPERIGAAVLLSLVDDAIAYETAKASSENGGGAQGVAVFQSTTQSGQRLAERILDSTINIKPTIYKHQGDRATIFVSRDLDFGGVYALRPQ